MPTPYSPPIHFIGIGGSGMAPLAELAQKNSLRTQGSDVSLSESTTRLSSLGVKVFSGHRAENINDAKTVVVSSAIDEKNPELVAARAKNLKIIHRSDFLKFLMEKKKAICVAGTHGKTTTTALITHALTAIGQDPSAAVGGKMLSIDSPAQKGSSPLFVAEVDESDGTITKYEPYIGILSNVDSDHLNHFSDINGLQKAFLQYLENVDPEGYCIIGWDNAHCREIGLRLEKNRLAYGFAIGSDVRATDYVCKNGVTTFRAIVERDQYACKLNMIGQFNVLNALCALATIRALELDVAAAAKSLETFAGVSRRQSLVYSDANLKIIDDYAHNPGKISALLNSIKDSWQDWQLVVVFQPHRYSRLQTTFEETCLAFSKADAVFVMEVYSAGETLLPGLDAASVAKAIAKKSHVSATPVLDVATISAQILAQLQKPAIILTVGAGDVWKVGLQVKDDYEQKT